MAFGCLQGGSLHSHLHSLVPWLFFAFFHVLKSSKLFPSVILMLPKVTQLSAWGHAVIEGDEASRSTGHGSCSFTQQKSSKTLWKSCLSTMWDTGQNITRSSSDLAVFRVANVIPGQGKAPFLSVGAQSRGCSHSQQKLQGCPNTFIFL